MDTDFTLEADFGYAGDVWRWLNLVVVGLACAGIVGTMILWNAGTITFRSHVVVIGFSVVTLIINVIVEIYLSRTGGHIELFQQHKPEPRGFDVIAPKDEQPHDK